MPPMKTTPLPGASGRRRAIRNEKSAPAFTSGSSTLASPPAASEILPDHTSTFSIFSAMTVLLDGNSQNIERQHKRPGRAIVATREAICVRDSSCVGGHHIVVFGAQTFLSV